MQIAITGAAGFLGRRLIEALLQRGHIIGPDGSNRAIESICAFDVIDPEGYTDPRVRPLAGDITDPAQVAQLIDVDTISVFHLAAVVSSQAEEDFDLGMRVNIDATRMLMERVRAVAPGARFVTTSSVAVFGGTLPDTVPDSQVWQPQSSYGTQKAINDLLLSDYSRRDFLDGRSLRMPTIVVRPGKPNRAASSFASGIIREPLAGIDAVCPVSLDTVLWLMSPALAIRNILHGHDLDKSALGGRSVINMPGLSVTVADMLQALRRLAGDVVADRVRVAADPAIQRIVNSWPGNFSADTARGLGFTHDADFDAVVRAFMSEQTIQTG
ncbi:D-erythronate dehydrogenase [Lichenicola sp.]|uniref:D-erythronate dehydrogenase n=1 Tax=Lichenicola sp. TaxID=2804529 RepID=UPI003AFF905A